MRSITLRGSPQPRPSPRKRRTPIPSLTPQHCIACPTKYRTSDAYALIIAHVNEVGQFVLRELLESGSSDTHWQRVCKDRVMFLLDIPEGSGVSSTVQSRAHHVIHCG
mmetsp:Transcript_80880/g.142590  ORF Transcript_80880/g.142590 Transcript_80880/m.142590 type:complete len:108 (+) Transcript_80880:1900-2223(+)